MKIAREDLGVTTKVSPVVSVNLDPASDPAADRTTTFSTVHFAGTTTPNASVTFLDQSGGGSTTATADSTGAYSILVPLVSGSNTFTVTTKMHSGSRSAARSRRWSIRRQRPEVHGGPAFWPDAFRSTAGGTFGDTDKLKYQTRAGGTRVPPALFHSGADSVRA